VILVLALLGTRNDRKEYSPVYNGIGCSKISGKIVSISCNVQLTKSALHRLIVYRIIAAKWVPGFTVIILNTFRLVALMIAKRMHYEPNCRRH
jgi:hypothetical protein